MHSRPVCSSAARQPYWLKLAVTLLMVMVIALMYSRITKENSPSSYIPDKTYKLTIINTSELFPQYPQGYTDNNSQLPQRQTLIDQIRREVEADGGKLLLLSGGELSSDDDILNLKQLNQLGYHAMAVSPLLFDEPLHTIRIQEATADFPFLSANLYESETGRPVFDAYALFDFDGLRIAVMGITRPGYLDEEVAENSRGIELIDPELATSEMIPYLRRQADIVIVATHGMHYPTLAQPDGKTVCPVANIAGIDLLVAGNNALTSDEAYPVTDTSPSVKPSSLCSTVGRIDLEFRNGELKKKNVVQINLMSKRAPEQGD